MAGRVRVFCAVSLDGFLAGVNDDLSWLPGPSDDGDDGGFAAFLSEVGALLMGRRTYDVVAGFDVPWPYGERAVLVATHQPLPEARPQVRAVAGPIHALVAQARDAARGQDVYVDGGHLVRDALDAGLVDELTLTLVPVVLGQGIPLFAGCSARRRFRRTAVRPLAHGMVQLELVPE
jgi:dihydrofolate reductase